MIFVFGGINFAYADITYPFSLTTTTLPSDDMTFKFTMSAAGIFYVDCDIDGNDGILTGNGVSGSATAGWTINRTNNTTNNTYTCAYSDTNPKTIQFGGTATTYNTDVQANNGIRISRAAIGFYVSKEKVQSISGNLSTIFPWHAPSHGRSPMFYQTFKGCTNLTSIPEDLFADLAGCGVDMFRETFMDCTGLTSIPTATIGGQHQLFSFGGASGPVELNSPWVFASTFEGCTNLTSIPSDLFSRVKNNNGLGVYAFGLTFSGCTALTAIPGTLFSTITKPSESMFGQTFSGCEHITEIPANLFNFGNTSNDPSKYVDGASSLFYHTFFGCKALTKIPSGLFSYIKSSAPSMFSGTFGNCTGLQTTAVGGQTVKPIPDNLFNFAGNYNISGAKSMFESTFYGCSNITSIPDDLFSHVKSGAETMFNGTFVGCEKLESIPDDLFNFAGNYNISGAKGMFGFTFYGCEALTSIPATLFSHITSGAESMFNGTFKGCTGLKYLPENLFSSVKTPAEKLFYQTFYGCNGFEENNGAATPSAEYNFIPKNLFSVASNGNLGLINESNPNQSLTATDMMTGIFNGASLSTQCPADYYRWTTGYESAWDNQVSCTPCPPGSHSPAGSTNESECLYLNITYVCGEGTGSSWIDENSPYEENATVTLLELPGEHCIAPETRAFSEWRCTYGDDSVIEPVNGEFSMPSAPVTCTAQWNNCADGYYWSGVTNKCEPGYTITLNQQSACLNQYPAQSSEPTVLYTIHGTGVYFDEERTQPMGHMDSMEQMPTATCKIERYLPNIPTDPTHNDEPYVVIRQETVMGYNPTNEVIEGNSMSPIERTLSGGAFVGGPQGCLNQNTIDSAGYITECGSNMGKNTTQDITWTVWNYTLPQINVMTDPPRIPGYDVSWYSNPGYSGDALTNLWCGQCNPSSAEPTKIYAKFTPQVKNVLYRPGKHAVMTPAPYTHVNAITYDGPYTALSFSDAPINWQAEPGYVFVGWTTHLTSDHLVPEFDEDDNLIGKFTSVEHFHIASLHPYHGPDFDGLQLTAAYKCDTAKGYYWNSNKTACLKDNIITYNVDAPENAGIITPEPETVTQGTQHTLAEIEIPAGYTWTGWDCKYTDTNGEHTLTPNENNAITMPSAAVICTGTGWNCDTEHGYNWTDENHTACSNEYNITYNVTNTNDATVPTPDQETFTAFATDYSLAELNIPNGYNCSVWSCTYIENNEPKPLTVENGIISSMPATAVTCNSTCNANTLNLRWDTKGGNITEDLPNSCTYKTDTIELTTPTKTGYDFKGWKVMDWEE